VATIMLGFFQFIGFFALIFLVYGLVRLAINLPFFLNEGWKHIPLAAPDQAPTAKKIILEQPPTSFDRVREFNPFQFKPSKNPVEESVLLRLLVQILAAIACISADVAGGTKYSLVAIPLMTAGAIWSYQRRHLIQTWMTRIGFICAVVLVLVSVIGAFLGQTIQRINDTGSLQSTGWLLLLTMLLVTMQMLRSWTLYYRINLSNSLFLSALLISRAAASAQGWGFVLVISIFLAVLLPALLLTYRSVLKLPPVGLSSIPSSAKTLTEQSMPWQDLAKIAVLSMAIGGILALFLPHFQMSNLGIKPPNLDQISAEIVEKLPLNQGESGLQIPGLTINGGSSPGNISPSATESPATSTPPPYAPLPSPQVAQLTAVQQDISTLANNASTLTSGQSEQIQAQVQQLETAINPTPTANNPTPTVDPEQVSKAVSQLQTQLQQLKTPSPSPSPSSSKPLPSATSPSPSATSKPLSDLLKKKLAELQKQIGQSITATPSPSLSPSPKPSETPLTPQQESRWTNIVRVAAVLLALTAGLIWYLRQQQQQQKIQQHKDQKFNKLPTIERVYLLMLTELRKTGAHRSLTKTEREFAHWVDPKYPGLLGQVIADISADYVSWRYGKRKISNEVASQKFAQFRELHSPYLEQKKKT
jgi:hypothetical protein